jgi:hypothetical protein
VAQGSYYHGHEYAYLKDVILSKGTKQDLAWVRNDPHVDEICRALKLKTVACEHYGVHLIKVFPHASYCCDSEIPGLSSPHSLVQALQKVNMNKLRAEHASQMRKRKDYERAEGERRAQIEREMIEEQQNSIK